LLAKQENKMPQPKKKNIFFLIIALLTSWLPQSVKPSSQTQSGISQPAYIQTSLLEQRIQSSAKSAPPPDDIVNYFREFALSKESPLPPISQIDYAKLQLSNLYVTVDQAWELFDLYFPIPENPSPSTANTPSSQETTQTIIPDGIASNDDYQNERSQFTAAFLKVFYYVLDASATGIIGGFVYDALKNELEKLRNGSKGKNRDCYDKSISDLSSLGERLKRAEQNNESVYIKDMARYTGGNTELARAWAKSLGWTHQGNGVWFKPNSNQNNLTIQQTAG